MSLGGGAQLRARLKAIGNTREFLRGLQIGTVEEAKRMVPRRTGHLGRNIRPSTLSERDALVVAQTPYAAYVERGTGIYGPHKKPIVPRTKKMLAWRTGATRLTGTSRTRGGRQLAGWAFARSVRGRKATPYLVPGAKKAANDRGADIVVSLWNGAA